jgi:hypothetical protein
MKLSLLLRSVQGALILFAMASLSPVQAGSATWSANPTSGDWNTAANWSPNGFPNDPTAVATFDVSDTTDISLSGPIQVGEIVFNSGASTFTITGQKPSLRIYGAGITNNSGIVQNLITAYGEVDGYSKIALYNSATIGSQVNITTFGGLNRVGTGQEGGILFYGNSSAGEATLLADDSFTSDGSLIEFNDQSTAGNSHITLHGNVGWPECNMFLWDSSSAGNATITLEGEASVIDFRDNSTASYANITIKGGSDSYGGRVYFNGGTADHATFVVEGGTAPGNEAYLYSTVANATLIVQGGGRARLSWWVRLPFKYYWQLHDHHQWRDQWRPWGTLPRGYSDQRHRSRGDLWQWNARW